MKFYDLTQEHRIDALEREVEVLNEQVTLLILRNVNNASKLNKK